MAKRTRSTTTREFSLNTFSFWIIVIIGIAMLVSSVLNFFDWSWVYTVSAWVQSICFALGMFVPIALSFRAARNKHIGLFILWIVCVVLVAFGLITNIISLIKLF